MGRSKSTLRQNYAAGLGAAVLLATSSVGAQSDSDDFVVTATVGDNCVISAGDLDFGTYDPVGTNAATPLDGTSTITVTCTDGASTQITLSQGANADTGSTDAAPDRRMANVGATSFLSYELFRDASHTLTWGADASVDLDYSGTGAQESITVFGRVAAGQSVPADSYSDTVTATINF